MKRKFAFMIHPREMPDFYRRFGNMLGISEESGMKYLPKIFPSSVVERVLPKLKGRWGFTVCSRFDVSAEIEGYIIAVFLTGRQMINLPPRLVRTRILDAILFAWEELRVERVGLGAYTAPFTDNGLVVVKDERIHCAVTHGDGLSAASSVEAVRKGAEIKRIALDGSTVAVVGAYGIVGRASSILLSELKPQKMILTGPNERKLGKIKEEVSRGYNGEISVSSNNTVIKEADIIVLSTTAPGSIVVPSMLKQDAIVVDMAQPHNMDREVCRERPDVLRIDGGYMTIRDINLGFKMGPPEGTTFACLTETIVSMLDGDTANHVGPIDIAFAKKIYGKAQQFGFRLAPLTNFSCPINGGNGGFTAETEKSFVHA